MGEILLTIAGGLVIAAVVFGAICVLCAGWMLAFGIGDDDREGR